MFTEIYLYTDPELNKSDKAIFFKFTLGENVLCSQIKDFVVLYSILSQGFR